MYSAEFLGLASRISTTKRKGKGGRERKEKGEVKREKKRRKMERGGT